MLPVFKLLFKSLERDAGDTRTVYHERQFNADPGKSQAGKDLVFLFEGLTEKSSDFSVDTRMKCRSIYFRVISAKRRSRLSKRI